MNLNFSTALAMAKQDKSIARAGWSGKNLKVKLQKPDQMSKMNLPYLYIEYPDGKRCPWLASQTDILADDWFVIVPVENTVKSTTTLYAYRNERGTTTYLETEFAGNQYLRRQKEKDKVIQ